MLDLQVDQNAWNRDVDTSLGHDNETLLKHSMKHDSKCKDNFDDVQRINYINESEMFDSCQNKTKSCTDMIVGHKRPITFIEAIEISGETSNIGGNTKEFPLVNGLDKIERAVRKSEQDLRIYEPGQLIGQILHKDKMVHTLDLEHEQISKRPMMLLV